MECSGFIGSERRAEACLDLAGNRRFGKDHQGGLVRGEG